MKQRNFISKFAAIAVISFIISGCFQEEKNPEITPLEIYDHIKYLASDDLQGRYPGTETSDLAAKYIYKQFKTYGLTPEFKTGYQNFEIVTGCSLSNHNYLVILNDSVKLNEQYTPLGF
ncbi:MAG: hypothetical protein JEZ09_13150, partial [Salinivirgaceae bacterium]|nr:hypothetical protein [Salinivirgaceae bacterium]